MRPFWDGYSIRWSGAIVVIKPLLVGLLGNVTRRSAVINRRSSASDYNDACGSLWPQCALEMTQEVLLQHTIQPGTSKLIVIRSLKYRPQLPLTFHISSYRSNIVDMGIVIKFQLYKLNWRAQRKSERSCGDGQAAQWRSLRRLKKSGLRSPKKGRLVHFQLLRNGITPESETPESFWRRTTYHINCPRTKII